MARVEETRRRRRTENRRRRRRQRRDKGLRSQNKPRRGYCAIRRTPHIPERQKIKCRTRRTQRPTLNHQLETAISIRVHKLCCIPLCSQHTPRRHRNGKFIIPFLVCASNRKMRAGQTPCYLLQMCCADKQHCSGQSLDEILYIVMAVCWWWSIPCQFHIYRKEMITLWRA